MITVTSADEPNTYLVEVRSRATTKHRVTVAPSYLSELGLAGVTAERVLQESFGFLLECEPNTAILARFDLREIERYFPEFRVAIGRRLRG